MKKSETAMLFALISTAYPRDERFMKVDSMVRDFWAEMLADIPFEAAKAALKASVSTSPFPPSISEIRDYATRHSGPRRLTADEAWGAAIDVIRTYSLRTVQINDAPPPQEPPARFGEPVRIRKSGKEYEAKRHCPPDVWAILERMGYADVCASENIDTIRAQFRMAWNAHDREEYENRVISGVLPELYGGNKQIGGVIDRIGGAV